MKEDKKIKYFLYARKSSESEERQVQSIEDQVNKLHELAQTLNLEVKEVLQEAKSAKKPYDRPVFENMLERIKKGEAQGILCWQINRLTRNPIDSGVLSWMLQQNILLSIQTIDRQFLPDDNVILFNVETGQANQFIIDLRKNCYRGMEGKASRGWLPSRPPIGYLNDKLEKTIVNDPDRFSLVRKMWDLMLTGSYTAPQVHSIATEEWGLTAKYSKNKVVPFGRSSIYRVFTNLFYTGVFMWDGKEYKGNHNSMITLEEYDRVQMLLGKDGKPRPSKHVHAYTGEITCGECGCMHTAVTKTKPIISTGEIKSFTYYYCTRKKKSIKCSQKGTLTESALEGQILKFIDGCEIHPQFLAWALDYLKKRNVMEIQDNIEIKKSRQKLYDDTQRELDNLTKMLYKELIDEDSFVKERDILKAKLAKSKDQLAESEDREEKWLELTEKTFKFATYAKKHFVNSESSPENKKAILLGLGWNHTITDQILTISKHEWLKPIESTYFQLKSDLERLELEETLDTVGRSERTDAIRLDWCAYRDSNSN